MFQKDTPQNFFSVWKSRLTKRPQSTPKPYLIPLLAGVALGILVLLGIFFKDLPSPTNLQKNLYPISTQILDRNGQLLYEIYDAQNRTPVSLDTLPKYVALASVAIEDKNFYHHHGFDTGGILRAAYKTISGQRLEGGSTITQQLVKVALLTPERTVSRKIKEAVLTVATEILYPKKQIIEMYLNHIPYGGTVYGIEAAAQTYFDKPAKDLTLAETALLAGLPQAPTRYSPFYNPEAAKTRMAQVLGAMLEQKMITQQEFDTAKNEELHFALPTADIQAPHFVMYVREILEQQYGAERLNIGGLRVTTTLDLDLQRQAEASLSAEMSKLKKLRISNGAALVTRPNTGEILAMVGSKNYFDEEIDGKVNITTRERQPGSSIKPLNYALGLESKIITPSTMLLDTPICFEVAGQADYCPKNYDNTFRGLTQIRFALGNSLNIPAVKVLAENGIPNFINFARNMGITTWDNPDNYGLSLTLGGGEVKMVDMAVAFGVFANNGSRVPLHAILKIEDNQGNVIESYNPEVTKQTVMDQLDNTPSQELPPITYPLSPQKVLSHGTSFLISHILSDNNARSASFGSNSVLNVPGQTVSVKTGTTNNLRDNWTVGYTPDFLVATWVGNNDNTPMSYVASGVTGASPIWANIMKSILKGTKTAGLTPPEGIIQGSSVCSDSGIFPAADNGCSTRYEYFLPGSVSTYNPFEHKDILVNKGTRRPPENEQEAADVELENHLVASDLFVKDYCLDCQPKAEGTPPTPPTYFPYNIGVPLLVPKTAPSPTPGQ